MKDSMSVGVDFFLALDKIGASSLTDDDCCQLLAWMHYDRGATEFLDNFALVKDIKVAQQRLNIYGGEVPNVNLIEKFNEFCKELDQDVKPGWFIEIEKKYNLK